MEDYWKVPRELIYCERKNLNDFGVKVTDSLNGRLFKLLYEHFLSTDDAKALILRCFNNAYYLCTIILLEEFPNLCVDKYEKNLLDMNVQWNEDSCAASFALAYEMLQVYDSKWQKDCPLLQAMYKRFHSGFWRSVCAANSFKDLIDKVDKSGTWLSKKEFEPRDIVETIKNVGKTLEVTEDEYNLYVNSKEYICERLANLEDPQRRVQGSDFIIARLRSYLKITYVHWGYDPKTNSFEPAEPGTFGAELDFEECFWEDVNPIKEALDYYINHCQTKNENDYKDETIDTPQTPETEVVLKERGEKDTPQPEPSNSETTNLQVRIHELQKALDEEIAKNTKLEKEIAHKSQNSKDDYEEMKSRKELLDSLYNAADNRLKRYESILGTEEQLNKEKKFSIAERIIFCSALLGCSLSEDDISQMQMAKLIARFSADKWESIRATISEMNGKRTALVEIAKKAAKEKDAGARVAVWRIEGERYKGITNAALNVYNYLHAAVKGETIGAKVYSCQQAMENIDQAYYLTERKLIDRTDRQPKGEFELPP
jgi:hypothetical protein